MSTELNKDAYEKLIQQDILWLKDKTKQCIKRTHILSVLENSIDLLYGEPKQEYYFGDVICNKFNVCEEAIECGGAKPHKVCSECGKCPFDKSARCVPFIDKNGKH